jgi:phosphatidate cytidylyltransferase
MTSPHVKRVLTSLLLLPLLGWAIYSGDPVLSLAITAVAGLGLMEFYAMFWAGREKPVWKTLGLLLALGMIWAPLSWSGTALVCLAMLGVALAFLIAHDRVKSPDAFKDGQILLFGLLYLPFILRLLRTMSATEIGLVLLTTFAADTGAYYAGSLLGGPKIWPSVSPKKTWAGSLGGLCLSVIVCTAMGIAFGAAHWTCFRTARSGPEHRRAAWRLFRVRPETLARSQGFGQDSARPWRHPGPHRQPALHPSPLLRARGPVLLFRLRQTMKYISGLSSPVFDRPGPRTLAILGSTGSIGVSALKVVAKNRDDLDVVALAGARNMTLLARQADQLRPAYLGVLDQEKAMELRGLLPRGYSPQILIGQEGYTQMATLPEADLVLAAQVGAAGLVPALAAARPARCSVWPTRKPSFWPETFSARPAGTAGPSSCPWTRSTTPCSRPLSAMRAGKPAA